MNTQETTINIAVSNLVEVGERDDVFDSLRDVEVDERAELVTEEHKQFLADLINGMPFGRIVVSDRRSANIEAGEDVFTDPKRTIIYGKDRIRALRLFVRGEIGVERDLVAPRGGSSETVSFHDLTQDEWNRIFAGTVPMRIVVPDSPEREEEMRKRESETPQWYTPEQRARGVEVQVAIDAVNEYLSTLDADDDWLAGLAPQSASESIDLKRVRDLAEQHLAAVRDKFLSEVIA